MLLKLPIVQRIRVRYDSSLLVDVLCMQTSLIHRLLRICMNLITRIPFKLESSADHVLRPNQLTIDSPTPLCIILCHIPLLHLSTRVTHFLILSRTLTTTWHNLMRLSQYHDIVTVRLRHTSNSFLVELSLGSLVNWMHPFCLFFL